jgi:hypothetical protein
VGEVVVGVLNQPLHAAPGGEALGPLTANVALVLEVREPWVRVLGGDGALGWLEQPVTRRCPAALSAARGAGEAVGIRGAERREVQLFDGPAQLMFLQSCKTGADGDWLQASDVRVVCAQEQALQGHLVAPFVQEPWPAGRALAQASDSADITSCALVETWRSVSGSARVAALYSCQSASGPQHLLALGDGGTVQHAQAVPFTRAQLTRAQEIDLDGDGAAEWLVGLAAAGAETQRQDVWIADGARTHATVRTLAYTDETGPNFRMAWTARASSGVWSVLAAGGEKRCEHFVYRSGVLSAGTSEAAFCRCAFDALASGSIPERCRPAALPRASP